jgi:BirA family transcriptional regulator, biotin operon repressor / biotin---[acetyl-CoA-carboxylase] ligase
MQGDRIADAETSALGRPRLHLRRTDSTNERARMLAISGAPHGTLLTTDQQTAGRGRQGRTWSAPTGSALLCSLVLRNPPALLSLIAGVATCEAIGESARMKWPNDVVVGHDLSKLAGILVEGRPQEGWAVLGIGLNVAVKLDELPREVRDGAASLELPSNAIEALLSRLLEALEARLGKPIESTLEAWRARDALLGREIRWSAHGIERLAGSDRHPASGRASGIDEAGRLIVTLADGSIETLDAGEVHLERAR